MDRGSFHSNCPRELAGGLGLLGGAVGEGQNSTAGLVAVLVG